MIYEDLFINLDLSDYIEFYYGVGGFIIVDDFVFVCGGIIKCVEWWGSVVISNNWEFVFYIDDLVLY